MLPKHSANAILNLWHKHCSFKSLNKTEATQLAKTIQNEIGTDITMGTTAAFETALKEYFSNKPNLAVTEQEAKKMHSYAVETAMDDTDDATYQAMEL